MADETKLIDLDKPLFKSKTIWGVIVAVLGFVLPALGLDIDVTPLASGTLGGILQVAGSVLAIVGLRDAVARLINTLLDALNRMT